MEGPVRCLRIFDRGKEDVAEGDWLRDMVVPHGAWVEASVRWRQEALVAPLN